MHNLTGHLSFSIRASTLMLAFTLLLHILLHWVGASWVYQTLGDPIGNQIGLIINKISILAIISGIFALFFLVLSYRKPPIQWQFVIEILTSLWLWASN